ncbi:hypothetical protein C8R46DRAFT_1077991 [Mycena filopes]|nr:hypothetical protein C8R46DRAFT_1077991 [Mycena filopes]
MSLTTESASVLPLDLQREIFEICAYSRPTLIPRLMLVAWNVKEWLEPLLYHTLCVESADEAASCLVVPDGIPEFPILTVERVLSLIQSRPAPFFHNAVRNLYFTPLVDKSLVPILTVCTGVENLWMVHDELELDPLVSALPLKHLYGRMAWRLIQELPPTHDFFSRLTHLEVLGVNHFPSSSIPDTGLWATALGQLPQLTHVAFNTDSFIPHAAAFLDTCKTLSVLAFILGLRQTHIRYATDILAGDPRFVVTKIFGEFLTDWQTGVHSGGDYWSRIEHFIWQRRIGEVDALQYEMDWEVEVLSA